MSDLIEVSDEEQFAKCQKVAICKSAATPGTSRLN